MSAFNVLEWFNQKTEMWFLVAISRLVKNMWPTAGEAHARNRHCQFPASLLALNRNS